MYCSLDSCFYFEAVGLSTLVEMGGLTSCFFFGFVDGACFAVADLVVCSGLEGFTSLCGFSSQRLGAMIVAGMDA